MSTYSSRLAAVAPIPATGSPSSASLADRLAGLYALVEGSAALFGSPLGQFYHQARHFSLPRFAYFGEGAGESSIRLAFLGGFDHRDLRDTWALAQFVEDLALRPDPGAQLSLAVFPLLDVLGLAGVAPERALAGEHWARTIAPELLHLEKDVRRSGYHGFVRLEKSPADDLVTVRLHTSPHIEHPAPGVELLTSDDLAPWAVRWEAVPETAPAQGPLTIAADLPFQPFEIVFGLPAAWPEVQYRTAAVTILRRFIERYRGFMAWGQDL